VAKILKEYGRDGMGLFSLSLFFFMDILAYLYMRIKIIFFKILINNNTS